MSAHKAHGGNVLTVMKYFIQQLCVRVINVIHSQVIVGSARMKCKHCHYPLRINFITGELGCPTCPGNPDTTDENDSEE